MTILHGKQAAIVQVLNETIVESIMKYVEVSKGELEVDGFGRTLHVIRGKKTEKKGWDNLHDERVIEQELSRLMDKIIRDLVTLDAEERRLERRRRKAKHVATIAKHAQLKQPADKNICWDYVRRGGQCKLAGCVKVHQLLPVTMLPLHMRFLVEEDHFPTSREACTVY